MKKLGERVTFPNDCFDRYPTGKQQVFLDLRDRKEVFFGGAAGGGKSMALLMGAFEYVKFPGYAALILRKDFARLELAGGLIPRSHELFSRCVTKLPPKWIASRRQWIFPNEEEKCPATIMFGYLSRPLDKFRYASSEFQYIAFDELTEFSEEDYLFMFSRLRRNTSLPVPLRMRSASNPGGPGHGWVKERFIPEAGVQGPKSKVQGLESKVQNACCPMTLDIGHGTLDRGLPPGTFEKQGRIYVPSRIADNQHLDGEEYRQSLLHLPPVERERLMNGDWSVQRDGLLKAKWLRYFVEDRGQVELFEPSGRSLAAIVDGTCRRFATVDPAGTSAERTQENKGRRASWTVVQVWDQPPRELAKFLLLRHEARKRVGFDGLCELIVETYRQWEPEKIWIEGEKLGQAVFDMLKDDLPIECLPTGNRDKVSRAGKLIMKLERGEVFLPQNESAWRPKLEREFLAWTGDEREEADQIDAAAYAAIVAEERMPRPVRIGMGAVRG